MISKKSKKNTISRLALAVFLTTILVPFFSLVFFASAPKTAQAYSINLQVPIPTLTGGETNVSVINFNGTTKPIADYIIRVYNYAVGIVGILAAVMMMIGGLMWITAGGNTSNISEAKTIITASLSGLVLVLTSYLILSNVNPALVNLQSTVIGNLTPVASPASTNCSFNMNNSTKKPECNSLSGENFCTCEHGNTWKFDSSGCAGTDPANGVCCCQIRPANCPARVTDCGTCLSCIDLKGTIPCKDNCQLNQNFAGNFKTAYDKSASAGVPFTITEGWPPTVNHVSTCHKNGTCADVNLSNGSTASDDVVKLAMILRDNISKSLQYECAGASDCCTKTYSSLSRIGTTGVKCVYNEEATGNHFHINMQ